MIIIKESRSTNYKENVAKSFQAIQHVIQLLFSTPQISMPYSLGLGFELKDFLFKLAGSDSEQRTLTELNSQIKAICGDETIRVDFSREGDIVNLHIEFTYDSILKSAKVPVMDLGDDNYQLSFKDVVVI